MVWRVKHDKLNLDRELVQAKKKYKAMSMSPSPFKDLSKGSDHQFVHYLTCHKSFKLANVDAKQIGELRRQAEHDTKHHLWSNWLAAVETGHAWKADVTRTVIVRAVDTFLGILAKNQRNTAVELKQIRYLHWLVATLELYFMHRRKMPGERQSSGEPATKKQRID